jgi:Lrp/AsnC family leucine-responsive transcriptional regulator
MKNTNLCDNIDKIDLKDRKIGYHLHINSRQSFNSIGKKVGLSKDVVAFRIKRLEKEGIIVGYPTWIQSALLGWGIARYYYTFQFVSPEKKQEIIDYFVNCDVVSLVSELEGSYDLQVNVYVSSLRNLDYLSKHQNLYFKFTQFYDQTQKRYRKYFDKQIMIVNHKTEWFYPKYLLGEKKSTHTSVSLAPPFKEVKIDKLDFNILRKLAVNARIPTLNLANDLNVTTATVKSRIKRLIQEKVIGVFTVNIDVSKTGIQEYNLEINLKDYDKKYEIIKFIKKYQNIIEISESFGRGVDLDIRFILKNVGELHDIINDLSSKFPETIKNFNYFSQKKLHKYNKVPFK